MMLKKTPKHTFSRDELIGTVERIERLYEEIKDLNIDVKKVFAEGLFDPKALRIVLSIRKLPEKRLETFDIAGAYLAALEDQPPRDGLTPTEE